eukprot:m.100984 g.100984  ORF g.100984 m.100984 type:complete len:281 (+) comp37104_c0_seq1:21-863(+)
MSIRWSFSCGSWIPTRTEWLKAAGIVLPVERDRIGKFVFQNDAKSAISGRLMIRKVLNDVFRIPYTTQQLCRTEKGRPFAKGKAGAPDIHSFNLSHSGNFAILAAELDQIPVGADVMRIDRPRRQPISDFFHTMRRQFTPSEWETIKKPKTETEQIVLFYRNWCLKESYVKALGIGIGTSLQRLEFKFDPEKPERGKSKVCSETTLKVSGVLQRDWMFEESYLNEDHCVAVATKKPHSAITAHERFRELTINDILDSMPNNGYDNQTYWEDFTCKRIRDT